MACACHGKLGKVERGKVPPDSQCAMCAYKHLNMARVAYAELSYETDNREWVAGHLRLATEHLKLTRRDFALEIRDMATDVELAKDADKATFAARLAKAVEVARGFMLADNPDVQARLDALPKAHGKIIPDVIIPLGAGSQVDNEELRMLLRSIDANLSGYGKVYLVTMQCPQWVSRSNVTIVEIPDKYPDNKDANLHLKTLETVKRYNIDHFLWCADDNAIMQPVEACDIPVIRNHRTRESFNGDGGRWRRRVLNTFQWADSLGVHLEYNFECHAPQVFDGRKLIEAMQGVDYVRQPGLTIYTTWRVATDTWRDSRPQNDYKRTIESATIESIENLKDSDLTAKLFLGYNDTAVGCGLIARLRQIFPNPCKFEVIK